MNILITGGNSKIGNHLLPHLKKSGHVCFILSRNKNNFNKYTRFGDLLDQDSLIKLLDNIDAIIHLAAVTHTNQTSDYFLTNTEGTKNIISAAEQAKIKKFIFISTNTASQKGGAYAHSKYQAEELLKKSSLNWLILKLSEVYGAGQNEAINLLHQQIKKNKIVFYPGIKKIYLQPVLIDDVCNAITFALNSNHSNKTYLLAGPEIISYRETLLKIAKYYHKNIITIPLPIFIIRLVVFLLTPFNLSPIKKDQLNRLLVNKPRDISDAVKDLNFNPCNFESGLRLSD